MRTSLPRLAPRAAILAIAAAVALPLATGTLRGEDAGDAVAGGWRALDAGMHHLGKRTQKDWKDAPVEAEGWRLDLDFPARANAAEATISIASRHVLGVWHVALNGAPIGRLSVGPDARVDHFPVAAGALKNGPANVITISPAKALEDIAVGVIRITDRPIREVLSLGSARVEVRDARSHEPIPARVTIVDARGRLADVYRVSDERTAVRRGILYTAGGIVSFEAPAGEYTLHATRGSEWGLATATVHITSTAAAEVRLDIAREVDTRGFIACDTHIHTFTHSGHGDASVEERLSTIAGEGVELAIATDHNHHTDYRPLQREMALGASFTAVTGNEVTTKNGHMNAFPMRPGDPPPPWKETDWNKLVEGIRAKGARCVVLNHPRWPKIKTGPFGVFELDRKTGERESGPDPLPVDAIEVLNATSTLEDPLYVIQDWFSLLDRGEKIAAVGSSDSHTVRDPVGQGRTYVPSATDDPSRIDVNASCDRIRRGETSIAYGIFADVKVDGSHGMGALVPVSQTAEGVAALVDVSLRVAAPGWVEPKRALFFLNGRQVAEREVPHELNKPTDTLVRLSIPLPPHDAYLVCVVLGAGVTGPFWPTEAPYTLAATNPVFLDRDRDGRYESPRVLADTLVRASRRDDERLLGWYARCDDAVATQILRAARRAWGDTPAAKARLEKLEAARPR